MNAIRWGAYALPFLLVLASLSVPPVQAGPVEDAICGDYCYWACREPMPENATDLQRRGYSLSCFVMCVDDGDWPCESPV